MSEHSIKSEQLSFYKLFAEKKYNIEIPIIQRDFAQGRNSATQVRKEFLDALHQYLYEGKPFRDLDFVYGDVDERGNLVPLDGQQRLTTLFLLHWYLAQKDGQYEAFKSIVFTERTSKFTYKTRTSSQDFCNALLENGLELTDLLPPDENQGNAISKTIKDSPWYFLSWEKDPTVQSMMRMLDAIHEKFRKSSDFYSKLADPINPVITFRFLPLKDYGFSDDLYIKMNSRGKPLTDFENFKARFEQHLSNEEFKSKRYKLIFEEEGKEVDAKTYFSHRIDTQWARLFWHFKIKKERKQGEEVVIDFETDSLMMNFIATLAINHAALTKTEVRYLIDKQSSLHFNFFTDLHADFVFTLIDALDIFSADYRLKTFLGSNQYYHELTSFKNIINKNFSDAAYWERIQFFAYYAYLVYHKGESEGLLDWMRVITNLSVNTMPYNDDTEFINSVRAIHGLLSYSNQILEYLKAEDSKNLKGFNQTQIKEERIKAHLITRSNEWKESILKHEKHLYFKGQLTFALAFSGIEAYYDNNNACNWSAEEDIEFLDQFNSYISKVFPLFTDSGLIKEALVNHCLHRAILSKGSYLIYAKSNFSFLNDSDRDVSWKRFLQGEGERKNNREYFKMVLDDPLFNINDLNSLEEIANKDNPEVELWQFTFILYPEVFNHLGGFKFIRFENSESIYLLRGLRMSGEHAELFSLCMYYELQKDPFFKMPKPFKFLKYHSPSGDFERPCFYLDKWEIDGHDFAFDGFYNQHGQYKLRFFDRKRKEFPVELAHSLEQFGFESEGESFVYIEELSEVNDTIVSFCEAIEQLLQEGKINLV